MVVGKDKVGYWARDGGDGTRYGILAWFWEVCESEGVGVWMVCWDPGSLVGERWPLVFCIDRYADGSRCVVKVAGRSNLVATLGFSEVG